MSKLFKSFAAATVVGGSLFGVEARGVELLTGGNLEATSAIPGWSLQEFRTGSTTSVDSAGQQNFANRAGEIDGEFGLWFKPWGAGNTSTDKVNAVLSQTVPGVAGESYTFSGWSNWQTNYSGGVDLLSFLSPLDPDDTGTVPSPTETWMELAFLDASNVVIGSPASLDLRTQQSNINDWLEHQLTGVAPAGTASVRVTTSMTDGVFNQDPSQSAYMDDFALKAASAPAIDLLTNGNLSTQPLDFPASFTLTELPAGRDTAGPAGFANHTTGGTNGLWLKSFSGTVADPSDAIFSQIVAGSAGTEYTLSAWSKFEAKYAGGVTTLDAASSSGAVASPTQTFLEITFLDASSLVIGTPVSLDLRTVQMNDNTWREQTLAGTAPAGTVSVQISAKMIDGVSNTGGQSAFFDDFSLMASSAAPGDYDGNGIVDGNDFLVIQRGFGSLYSSTDFDAWKANFGNGAAVGAVPEPASAGLVLLGVAAVGGVRRSRRIA
jgi:hypothetical protein